MTRKKIPENHYRASRVCRILGNPTAYEVLHILARGEKTPTELASILGVRVPTVSQVLRSLRQLDLIRYDVRFNERVYWIKEDAIVSILEMFDDLIKRIRTEDY